jgi:hypothetical protein
MFFVIMHLKCTIAYKKSREKFCNSIKLLKRKLLSMWQKGNNFQGIKTSKGNALIVCCIFGRLDNHQLPLPLSLFWGEGDGEGVIPISYEPLLKN